MPIHKLISSFNAGELSPLLDSRASVEKVESGCRRLENYIPHTAGPVFRRGGLEYRSAARSHTKRSSLRPFNFSTSTSAVLEFSPLGLRVLQNGAVVGLVEPVALPYSEQDCFEVQTVQVNDVIYLAHANHHPQKLIRLAPDRWVLAHMFKGLIEVGTPVAVDTTAGAQGKVRLDYYQPFTVTANVDTMISNPALSGSPTGGQDITDLAPPLVPAGFSYMRKITGNLTVPTTGNWIFTLPANARARFYLSGVSKITVGEGQPIATASADLVAGAEYSIVIYNWLGAAGSQDFKLQIEGPGFPIQVIGPAMLSKVDAISGGTYNPSDFGNAWPAMLDQNVTPTTIAVSAVTGLNRVATATHPIFKVGHVGSFWQVGHTRESSSIEIIGAVGNFAATSLPINVIGPWSVYSYGLWSGTLFLERKLPNGTWEIIRQWTGNKDRNIIDVGNEDITGTLQLRMVGGNGAASSEAAVPRFLLEASDARIYGLIYIKAVSSDGLTATVDVKRDLHSTAATSLWNEGAWSEHRGYPRALSLHKGSMYFGGTASNAGRIWKSAAGDWENFRITSLADGAIDITIAAEESNAIQWLCSQGASLLIGTAGEEWSLSPSSGDIITALTASVERQSRYGSAYLPSLMVNDVPVFVQRGGRKVRKLLYNEGERKYAASDLTVLASHITKGGIVQMAFQSQFSPILWVVTGDGILIGMTHETEQNVFAWHRHITDGIVESAAVISGSGQSDELWVIVNRTVEGATRRFIERMDLTVMAQDFADAANLNYLDSSRHHIFLTPGVIVPGLEHLEGRIVSVLVDGAVHPNRLVSSGAITLQSPGTHVIAGLPFTSLLQTMRQEFQMNDGTSQGRKMKAARCTVRFHQSSGGEAADDPDGTLWEPIVNREAPQLMGVPPPLATSEQNVNLSAKHRTSINVAVRQTAPLPLTITALVFEVDVYQAT